MKRQNEIKVFKPNSKQADYTIRSVTPSAGVAKLAALLDEEAAEHALASFESLEKLGAESMTFRHEGRKIKVEMPIHA